MQSQAKIFCCLALLLLKFPLLAAAAATPVPAQSWLSISTPKMEVLEQASAQGDVITSYIPFFVEIGDVVWGWDPKKEPKNTSEIYRESDSGLNELMRNLFVKFDLSDNAHFRKVWFRPKSGLQFRGLWGIHDFNRKRPLVIIRMGIHGNVDEVIAERFLARAIYEDLDANFLILESLTSHAFLSTNKNVSFGGIDEGLQTFFAISELFHSPFNSLIQSYHIVSISMGGHGTFVTALLDQNNEKILKSIVNFCPLINLRETIEHHESEGLKATFVDLWNVRRLKALFDLYPDRPALTDWWKSLLDFKPRFTPAAMGIINQTRTKPLLAFEDLKALYPKLKVPAKFSAHLENSKSLFELNDFWPVYKGVKTPIMIYTTPNDPLVINALNSERIFRGVQPGEFDDVKYQRLERGIHCGLAPAYQWDYIVKLLREGLGL